MAYTTEQLAALRKSIAAGTLRVQYSDKNVIYRSLDEMLRIERLMAKDIAGTPSTVNTSTIGIRTGKGL